MVDELGATFTSMRREIAKLELDDLNSPEYKEVLFTYRLREISLLGTLENLDGKATVAEFSQVCYEKVGLSVAAQFADRPVGEKATAQLADLRAKWTEALTANRLALPFVSWDKFGTVSTFSGSEWAQGKLPADISKTQLLEVKKSWDEFKQMIGLYLKGSMFAATKCSPRKTALANKTTKKRCGRQREGG